MEGKAERNTERAGAWRVALWRALVGEGLEHLVLQQVGSDRVAEGQLIGVEGEKPFGLHYRFALSEEGSVRAVRIASLGRGPKLELRSDGRGQWWDAKGAPLPALAGCTDLDLAASAFTNSLPIRRLGLRGGESRDLRVLYVTVPALEVFAVQQRYTCLEEGRRYRYEGHPPGFSADLSVDEEGLVVDYPGLFERVV